MGVGRKVRGAVEDRSFDGRAGAVTLGGGEVAEREVGMQGGGWRVGGGRGAGWGGAEGDLGSEREGQRSWLAAGVEALGALRLGLGVLACCVLEGGRCERVWVRGVVLGWWWLVGEGAAGGGRFLGGVVVGVESLRLTRGGGWWAWVVVAGAERLFVAVRARAIMRHVGGTHGWRDGQTADATLLAEAAERGAGGGAAVGG